MDSQKLKEKVTQVLGESKVGTLATVVGNKPHSRYMTFFNEDLTLYTPTSKETYKAEEIERNPNVHILLGYEGEGMGDAYIEYREKLQSVKISQLRKSSGMRRCRNGLRALKILITLFLK